MNKTVIRSLMLLVVLLAVCIGNGDLAHAKHKRKLSSMSRFPGGNSITEIQVCRDGIHFGYGVESVGVKDAEADLIQGEPHSLSPLEGTIVAYRPNDEDDDQDDTEIGRLSFPIRAHAEPFSMLVVDYGGQTPELKDTSYIYFIEKGLVMPWAMNTGDKVDLLLQSDHPNDNDYDVGDSRVEDAQGRFLIVEDCDLFPSGSSFTYQGELSEPQGPANGAFDFGFSIYDAPVDGNQIAAHLDVSADGVDVVDGLFTVQVDFGGVQNYVPHYLQISVNPSGSGATPTVLAPRQRIHPVPLALHANISASYGDTNGSDTLATLLCADDQIPKWNDNDKVWSCANDELGGSGGSEGGDFSNGIVLGGVSGDAFFVESAGDDGIQIGSASEVGFHMQIAGKDGLRVVEAGWDGVAVATAGRDGYKVCATGNRSCDFDDMDLDGHHGIEIGNIEHDGIHVINAGRFAGFFGGEVRAQEFTTVSGADLAERFDVNDAREIEPGMVVSIDAANPGALRIADASYDRTVAGIISGAGGIQPGITLGQEGTLAYGEHSVSLSGRVYVLADATHAAIVPGDLLTTSDTVGHAMKVQDHAAAQGAILGKAMTPLNQGRGLVLVLVSLQ